GAQHRRIRRRSAGVVPRRHLEPGPHGDLGGRRRLVGAYRIGGDTRPARCLDRSAATRRPSAVLRAFAGLLGAEAKTRDGRSMSSTSDDESRAKGSPKGRPSASDRPVSDSGSPPSSGENQLDIEPDALLDSLLADGDEFVEGPLDSEHDGSFPDEEEEVTSVVKPPAPKPRTPVDEFSDVDDLLTKSTPPPKGPAVAVKSAKATLQGIRPPAPRPGVPRPQAREFLRPGPSPRSPAPRSVEPSALTTTRKPPPVNPAGPPPREPFLPAMSPKAPPARVRKLTPEEADVDDNSSEEEPTFRAYVTDADLEAS